MAVVDVSVTNLSGNTVVLGLDETEDAERIAYLRTLVRREDLDKVTVAKRPATKAPATK